MKQLADHQDAAASAAGAVMTPAAKVATVWTGVAVGSMRLSFSDIAAILAAIYSGLLIADWVWKKFKTWRAERG